MKATKFSETQIAFVLKQADERTAIAEVCRKAAAKQATILMWIKATPAGACYSSYANFNQ